MSLSHGNNGYNDNQKIDRQQADDDDKKAVDDCVSKPKPLLDPPQSTATTATTTKSTSTKSIKPCCFYYKFGVCDPPRPPCRFDHVEDDGKTPCCFGATCRMGHAKRVRELVGATYDQRVAYWTQHNNASANHGDNANANHHDPKEALHVATMPLTPAQRNASLLQSQLEPWSTSVLRERLVTAFGQNRHDWEAAGRAAIMEQLLHCYQQQIGGQRRRIDVRGLQAMEVPPSVQQALLGELKQWRTHHTINTRPSIHAESYMILRKDCLSTLATTTTTLSRKARQAHKKLHQFASLWHMACHTLAQIVGPHDPAFCRGFSALAVTYNFRGSPHIDKQNTGPFYGLSLGEFCGGSICVEASYDTVAVCDSHNRFVKVDGRFPHWVDEYDYNDHQHPNNNNNGGNGSCFRYSLIYYSTTDQYQPPTVPYYFGRIVDDDMDVDDHDHDVDDKDIDES